MPLYEYRCRCCGERFERLVRTPAGAVARSADGDAPDGNGTEVACPRCRAGEVERLFSAFARVGGPQCDPLPSGAG